MFDRPRISKELIIVLAIAFVGAGICAHVGNFSDVSLGDEVYHFFLAKRWVESGERPITEPLIHANPRGQRKYVSAPLWHAGLAALWFLTGVGQTSAQLYQAAWYVVLVLAVYDGGRYLYGRRVGMWAAGLMACLPFAAAFTNMLYVDVSMMALTALIMACLLRRRFVFAAILLGLTFVTKRNSYLMVPGFLLVVVLLVGKPWKKRLLWAGCFVAIAAVVHVPDLMWRHANLGTLIHHPAPVATSANEVRMPSKENLHYRFVHPSNIADHPTTVVTYLGIPLLAGLALYFLRRPDSRPAWVVILPVLLYLPSFLWLFRGNWAMRYLAPTFPLLCLLSARGICSIKSRRWLGLLAIGGVCQFAAAEACILTRRTLSAPMREAYRWVSTHTAPDAGLMCLNAVLSAQTGRRAIWHTEASLPEIGYLLWVADEPEAVRILQANAIHYVFVEKDRIYDDSSVRYLPGYPQSFLDKLAAWQSTKRVFENPAAVIWQVAPAHGGTVPSAPAPLPAGPPPSAQRPAGT